MTTDTDTATAAIAVNDIHHAFKAHKALTGITFSVRRGALHGFVGPNGAGKTTALKLICTLLSPQRGHISVFGEDVYYATKRVRQSIGFMPDHFSMYRQMTVYEYLDFFGAAYGLTISARNQVIENVLELTDMAGRQTSLISGLSRGMQQRVSLARVLINDPDLLLLDEPASGLDPRARIELMDILRALQGLGKTIFISSHILSELAELCDSVTIIDRGQIKFSGAMDDLLERGQTDNRVILTFHDSAADVLPALNAMQAVASAEIVADGRAQLRVSLQAGSDTNSLLQEILQAGLSLVSVNPDRKHLNQAFMDLTQGGVA